MVETKEKMNESKTPRTWLLCIYRVCTILVVAQVLYLVYISIRSAGVSRALRTEDVVEAAISADLRQDPRFANVTAKGDGWYRSAPLGPFEQMISCRRWILLEGTVASSNALDELMLIRRNYTSQYTIGWEVSVAVEDSNQQGVTTKPSTATK